MASYTMYEPLRLRGYSVLEEDDISSLFETQKTSGRYRRGDRRNRTTVKSQCSAYEEHRCDNGLLKCSIRHSHLPYMWRVKEYGKWTELEENELIEQTFCNPQSRPYDSPKTGRINFQFFQKMTSTHGKIQRLSTPSYVTCRHQADATKWTWYWNTGNKQITVWLAFKDDRPPFQDVLESKFVDNPKQIVCYEIDKVKYELDFQTMQQTNVETGYKRAVCRRPIYFDDFNRQNTCFHYDPLKLPANEGWSPMDTETLNFSELVIVDMTAVESEFHRTMPRSQFAIHRIYRVQNLHMWQKFQTRTALIEKQYQATERRLFHGTPDYETALCICHQNLDPRLNGKHGTSYGQGSYFSTTASYSHKYTKESPVNGHHYMFYARVLMGRSTVGKPKYQRPPPVDPARPHERLYDSCVDNLVEPTIVVVFENDLCYPEFLIEYGTPAAEYEESDDIYSSHAPFKKAKFY